MSWSGTRTLSASSTTSATTWPRRPCGSSRWRSSPGTSRGARRTARRRHRPRLAPPFFFPETDLQLCFMTLTPLYYRLKRQLNGSYPREEGSLFLFFFLRETQNKLGRNEARLRFTLEPCGSGRWWEERIQQLWGGNGEKAWCLRVKGHVEKTKVCSRALCFRVADCVCVRALNDPYLC